jgi:glutathione S-transferase
VISDSAKIVAYLDEYYPEKPIFPLGKETEQLAFEQRLLTTIGKAGVHSLSCMTSRTDVYWSRSFLCSSSIAIIK